MTNKRIKNIILALVVALIVISIGYLEVKKPPFIAPGGADININASSTLLASRANIRSQKATEYPKAKELVDPSGFINTGPFKLSDIVGNKVVLIDFWTYSCINCLRTIPYLEAWYEKYKDDGLVIVGVHSPEFDFEKNYDNVSNAVKRLGIQYPVVMDNDHSTWSAYQNEYWPREYLIDIDGFIVHDKIGEGDYDGTEKAIQAALQERSAALGLNLSISTSIATPAAAIPMDDSKIGSNETYFGAARNEYLGNGNPGSTGPQSLSIPSTVDPNVLYLGGTWNFQDQYAENRSVSAKIVYKYQAKNVYLVASSKNAVKFKVLLDGLLIKASAAGKDVAADGTVTIQDNRLYDLVHGSDYGSHTLEIDMEGSGLDAYTFTFG